MFPSMRTKRRRVAAEVSKFIAEIEKDNLSDTSHLQNFTSAPVVKVQQNLNLLEANNLHGTRSDGLCTILNDVSASFSSFHSNLSNENFKIQLSAEVEGRATSVTYFNSSRMDFAIEYDDSSEWISRPVNNSDHEQDDSDDIQEQLANWAANDNISQASLTRLLHILKPKIPELPRDARSLLNTDRNIASKTVAGGEYYYFGLRYWLQKVLGVDDHLFSNEKLHLYINIDGIPMFNSSTMSLWPILGILKEVKGYPFPIALFCGKTKPSPVNEYLADFVSEMKDLILNGFVHDNTKYEISLDAIICDAPARAYIKCIKPHTGYHSCERCMQKGEWCKKILLPDVSARLRTNVSFLLQQDPNHHLGVSPFVEIEGIKMVSGFPLDYMHLVCLGVVRRMIHLWINGPRELRDCRLSITQINVINEHIGNLYSHIPREFSRRPRSLNEYMQWKATEFRLFLVYIGPICLKGVLSDKIYSNFLDFSVSVRILLSHKLCSLYLDYSEQLLRYFVSCFGHLYGRDQLVYNVHSLIHLADDARNFGVLDNISSFCFESFLGKLKKFARRPQMPCAQIARRVHEGSCQPVKADDVNGVLFKKQHLEGPLPLSHSSYTQYKQYFGNYYLSPLTGDNCCIIDDKVGVIRNILASHEGSLSDSFLVFEEFEIKEPFFTDPLDSQTLSIYLANKLAGFHTVIPIADKIIKCLLLPYKQKFVVLPQIHDN